MKKIRSIMTGILCATLLIFAVVSHVQGEEYPALKGVKSVNAVFDIRAGNPKSVAVLLKLFHNTYNDETVRGVMKSPRMAVVFIGPSVRTISTNREGFSSEDQKFLDEIAGTISAMAKGGMQLEICLVAARMFNVDPATVLPEIKKVQNGWISLVGYQAQGYSLVPAY
jgi:intracellular sulfur oxidation DsrE/DsrF family protein